jgi:hypothetical protein
MALTKIVDGVVIDLTAEEIAEIEARVAAADLDFSGVRNQRNGFLRNSDWTQLADSPVDSTLWVAYRQSLRDLPAAYSRVSEVVWPTPPE